MNTETPTTAAELLAEWKEMKDKIYLIDDLDEWKANVRTIAARLDGMCDDAGILLIDGAFVYHWQSLSISASGVRNGVQAYTVTTNCLDGREQQALQEWLLIKNENGK
jgi:hypothetical protein